MAVALNLFHVGQACLGVYTGIYSYTSIDKLMKYEEQAEKAAQYLNKAARDLHKTRTTQTSGALTTLTSLVSSIVLVILPAEDRSVGIYVCIANVLIGAFAYQHNKSFWKGKAKVPFVKDYSDAITTSNRMRECIGLLAVSWVLASVGHFWSGRS